MKSSLIASLVASVIVACGGNEPPKTQNDTRTTGAPTDNQVTTVAPTTTNVDPSTSSAPASPPKTTNDTPPSMAPAAPTTLNDGEIAGFLSAANNGEIEMAKVALKTSANAKVKAFANMMITQHTDAENKGKKVVEKEKLSATDSAASTKLKGDVDGMMTSLKSTTGADFDKAYMDAQVKAHKDVLAAIDEKAMPNVKDTALKTHLDEIRKHVAMHLQKAEELRQGLATTAATPTKR